MSMMRARSSRALTVHGTPLRLCAWASATMAALSVRALSRLVRRQLGLDVEAHRLSRIADQLEQLGQGRDALPVDGLLPGELVRVHARRIEAADVESLELGEGQGVDGGPRLGQP